MRWEGRQLVEGARRSLLSLCYKRGAVGVGVGTADTVYHVAHSTSLPLLRRAPVSSRSQCAQPQDIIISTNQLRLSVPLCH